MIGRMEKFFTITNGYTEWHQHGVGIDDNVYGYVYRERSNKWRLK